MVLSIVGLGLSTELDITLRGLNAIKNSNYIYLECYTSILEVDLSKLEGLHGKTIIPLDRYDVEDNFGSILEEAKDNDVALLVVGDPLCATTHDSILLQALKSDVKVEVIHNSSIITAIGISGLQIYKFGETVSIPFFDDNWKPDSFYHKINRNRDSNLHTLCLLDIKLREPADENYNKKPSSYKEPRFMTIPEAIRQLLELENQLNGKACEKTNLGFGMARLGSKSEQIISGTLEELMSKDFGKPLHSLIICAPDLDIIETEFFDYYKKGNSNSLV